MTTIYVDLSGSGAETSIQTAINKSAAGDTIVVRSGVYREAVVVNKPVTIVADDDHTPEINGGYGSQYFQDTTGLTGYDGKPVASGRLPSLTAANLTKENWLPVQAATNIYAPLVSIPTDGVIFQGIVVRNSAGRGIQVEGGNVTVRYCHVDFCYANGFWVGNAPGGTAKKADCVIEYNVITRGSMRAFDPTRAGGGTAMMGVDSCLILRAAIRPTIRGNVVAYNYAEGIAVGRGTIDALVIGNECFDNLNENLYVSGGGTRAKLLNNICYNTDNGVAEMSRATPLKPYANVTLGDELIDSQSGPDFTFAGNLIVGGDSSGVIEIGSWNGVGDFPRPFVFKPPTWFAFNTAVGGPRNDKVISFGTSAHKSHEGALFENNIFISYPGKPLATATSYGAGYDNVVFRNNVSSDPLPPEQVGSDSIVTDAPILVNPFAEILGSFSVESADLPSVLTNFKREHYALATGSPAIGAASDGSPINGVTPAYTNTNVGAVAEETLPEPEPEPVDLEVLFIDLSEKLQALQAAIEEIGAAQADTVEKLSDVGESYVKLYNAWEDGNQ
jgi:hypothetical protein